MVLIAGVDVEFPFEPYDLQKEFMSKLITALENGSNALLESPTGTGKTLSLLCAALAWKMHQKERWETLKKSNPHVQVQRTPTIIYASRTLSQISQVVKELKNTAYNPKVTILSSRDHMCVNSMVNQLSSAELRHTCRVLTKSNSCKYKKNTDVLATKQRAMIDHKGILDIEELLKLSRSNEVCPYFMARLEETQAVSEVVFMPYNYLFDPSVRTGLNVIWENAIVIIDEAHNVESVCDESASAVISATQLASCIEETDKVYEHCLALQGSAECEFQIEKVVALKRSLLALESRLSQVQVRKTEIGVGAVFDGGRMIDDFLHSANITTGTIEQLLDLLRRVSESFPKANYLDGLRKSLMRILPPGDGHALQRANKYFRLYVSEEATSIGYKTGVVGRKFNFWCFCPGVALRNLTDLGVSSIILTSGTLAPLGSFGAQLQVEFEQQLENPHVVKGEQIWLGVVKNGVTGKKLNSSYRFRNTDEYKREIGNTIATFARVIPDGMLVFFPSYTVMSSCVELWKRTEIYRRISRCKAVIVEPRSSSEMKASIKEYNELIADGKGAVFLAVCRGKASEGIDFANQKARAVVITGLPYAPKFDPQVHLKCKYLDGQKHSRYEKLTGNAWYSQQATRAVNQAVGRVIRHRMDYGAIILCDERFSYESQRAGLSKWLQSKWHVCSNFGEANKELINFYRNLRTKPELNEFAVSKDATDDFLDDDTDHGLAKQGGSLFLSASTKTKRDGLSSLMGKARKRVRTREHVDLSYEASSSTSLHDLYAQPTPERSAGPTAKRVEVPQKLNKSGSLSRFSMSSKSANTKGSKAPSVDLDNVNDGLADALGKNRKIVRNSKQLTTSEYARQRIRKQERKKKEAEESEKEKAKQRRQNPASTSDKSKKPDAKAFLGRCKVALNKSEYGTFKKALVQLKARGDVARTFQCLAQVVELFSCEDRAELREDFNAFIPKSIRGEYKRLLQAKGCA